MFFDGVAGDYHEAAVKQKEMCDSGRHLHSVMTEGGWRLQEEKPEHLYDWECCPCFGCCYPDLRKTVQ